MKITELRDTMYWRSRQWRGPGGPWEPYFAWKPRRDIHGTWHWLKRIYRREKNRMVYPSQGWEYGTMFDVIKDAR